jgi:sulfide:quinone oxidoreductase
MAETRRLRSYEGLHVLIAGGGVAALEAAFALRALAGERVYVELLTPELRFFYQPQAVLEPFGRQRVQQFELAELATAAGAQLTLGALTSVSPDSHLARTTHGMSIGYDALVIACGASPRCSLRDAVAFRGPADSDRIAAIVRDAQRGGVEQVTLAIPSCRTWPLPLYELAFGLRSLTGIPITIATAEPRPAAVLGPEPSGQLEALLHEHRIELATGTDFEDWRSESVTIAAPELVGNRIYGIPADEEGFIPINRFAAVKGVKDVYAAGDITSFGVKHGSLAAAQADTAAAAIAARSGADVPPSPFRAVLHAYLVCGEESLYVRRDLDKPNDPGVVSRDPLWSPAGKIFARHLAPVLAEISHRHQRSLLSLNPPEARH